MSNGDMPGQNKPEQVRVKQPEKKVEKDSQNRKTYTPPTDAAAWNKIEASQKNDKVAPAKQKDKATPTPQPDRTKGEKQPEKKVEKDKVSQQNYTRPADATAWDKIEKRQHVNDQAEKQPQSEQRETQDLQARLAEQQSYQGREADVQRLADLEEQASVRHAADVSKSSEKKTAISEPKGQSPEVSLTGDLSKVLDTARKSFNTVAGIEKVTGDIAEAVGKSRLSDSIAKAIWTAHDAVANRVMNSDWQRLRAISDSTSFRVGSSLISAAKAGIEASDRGGSPIGVAVDSAVAGGLSFVKLNPVDSAIGPKLSPVDSAIDAIHGITKAISPEAGKVTAIVADATPSQTIKAGITAGIDTFDALAHGDTNRVIKQTDMNLQGRYGEVVRGYAIAGDALGAAITGDAKALNNLTDAAAGGKLGLPAKIGDWIGDQVFFLLNPRR